MAQSARTSEKDDLLHRFVATFDALIGHVAMQPPPNVSQEMSFSPQEVSYKAKQTFKMGNREMTMTTTAKRLGPCGGARADLL